MNDAHDRLAILASLWRLIADLTIPERDLHCVDRDGMATALGYLADETAAALRALSAPTTDR